MKKSTQEKIRLQSAEPKKEYLAFNIDENGNELKMNDRVIKNIAFFKYLGSHVRDDGKIEAEINH